MGNGRQETVSKASERALAQVLGPALPQAPSEHCPSSFPSLGLFVQHLGIFRYFYRFSSDPDRLSPSLLEVTFY